MPGQLLNERRWDKRLKIETRGRDARHEDRAHHPYEPTPYAVLERIAESGLLEKDDVIADYGSGKGRAALFFRAVLGCRTVGIEFDPGFTEAAEENLARSGLDGVRFVCMDARDYDPDDTVTVFFFFNPFPAEVLRAALAGIRSSFFRAPRPMKLLFYYPSDEYLPLLMNDPDLLFEDEISTADLFRGKDSRERVLVFTGGKNNRPS